MVGDASFSDDDRRKTKAPSSSYFAVIVKGKSYCGDVEWNISRLFEKDCGNQTWSIKEHYFEGSTKAGSWMHAVCALPRCCLWSHKRFTSFSIILMLFCFFCANCSPPLLSSAPLRGTTGERGLLLLFMSSPFNAALLFCLKKKTQVTHTHLFRKWLLA